MTSCKHCREPCYSQMIVLKQGSHPARATTNRRVQVCTASIMYAHPNKRALLLQHAIPNSNTMAPATPTHGGPRTTKRAAIAVPSGKELNHSLQLCRSDLHTALLPACSCPYHLRCSHISACPHNHNMDHELQYRTRTCPETSELDK